MNEIFNANGFALQVISSGHFLDNDPGFKGKVFRVETHTVRLNHVAMNEWVDAQCHNTRDCYDTHEEWMEYLEKKMNLEKAFNQKVADALWPGLSEIHVSVKQIVSEVFGVAYIHEER